MDYSNAIWTLICFIVGIVAGGWASKAKIAQLEDEKKELKEALEKSHLFNDVFLERFHGYTRHDRGCTYDDLSKGDICTCGLRGLINVYYEIKDAVEDE